MTPLSLSEEAGMVDGGPAFAAIATSPMGDVHHQPGMSRRDWFAGQALAGLCANPGGPFQANGMQGWGMCNCDEHTVASLAADLADAILAELAERAKSSPISREG